MVHRVHHIISDFIRGPHAAEQVLVEMFPERFADKVESYGVDARVDVAETESDDAERVPHFIVVVVRGGVKMKPQHEGVIRQEANDEDDHES